MAVKGLAEEGKTLLLSMAAAEAIVNPVLPHVFKVAPRDSYAVEVIFQRMKKTGITRIGFLSSNTGFGKGGKEQVEKLAPQYGITLAVNDVYDKSATDLTAEVTKLKAANVQAILNWSIEPAQSIVVKNARQLGLTVPIFQSHGFANLQYVKAAGSAAEGVIFPASRIVVAGELQAGNPQKPVVEAYRKAYEARYGEDVSTFGGHAWDAFGILVAGHRAGGARPGEGPRRGGEHEGLRGDGRGLQLLADRPQRPRHRRLRALHGEERALRPARQLSGGGARGGMTIDLALQYLVAGLTYGAIYAVVAIGFNIVYSATGIINFAQGEFVMLGGMLAVQLSRSMPLPAAVALAVAATAAVGALVEVAFIRWLAQAHRAAHGGHHHRGLHPAPRGGALPLGRGGALAPLLHRRRGLLGGDPGGAHLAPGLLGARHGGPHRGAARVVLPAHAAGLGDAGLRRQQGRRGALRRAGAAARHPLLRHGRGHRRAGRGGGLPHHLHLVRRREARSPSRASPSPSWAAWATRAARWRPGWRSGVVESFAVSVLPAAYKDVVTLSLLLAVLVVRPSGLFASGEAARLKEF